MVGNVIEKKMDELGHGVSDSPSNSSNTTLSPPTSSGAWSALDKEKIIYSVTLSMVVGIIQVGISNITKDVLMEMI